MVDNRDPQTLGDQLLKYRKQFPDKTLSESYDQLKSNGVALGYTEQEVQNFIAFSTSNGHS